MAARKLKLAKATASYKSRSRLAMGIEDESINKVKQSFFSLNLDQTANAIHHKVPIYLVYYLCCNKKEIVIERLTSIYLPILSSETIYEAVVALFRLKELPWNHSISTSIDSCSAMRGSKNGFETKVLKKGCKIYLM